MDYQSSLIGKKIKKNSRHLAEKTMEVPIGGIICSLINIKISDRDSLLEEMFYHIGDYMISRDIEVRNSLASWADVLGQKAISSDVSLDLLTSFGSCIRSILLDLLEEEAASMRISTKALFDVIRQADSLIELVAGTITKLYIDRFSTTKFALDESTEDLNITLKELADFKNALNEATIFAITDSLDVITYANEKFCEITKYSRAELIGQEHEILNSGFHPPSFFKEIRKSITEGKPWKGEILNKAKDGTLYWVDTTIVPLTDIHGKTYQHLSIQYDITEKKRTEEMLRKAEKLSLVGELAAGIAHEIRNPLTTVKGFVQLLSTSHSEKKLLYADTILEEVDRINFIVSEFMVFAKPHATNYSECSAPEILRSVIKLLEAEAALNAVIISSDLPDENIYIYGEKNQLKQVFLNIIKNGIEALPNGGNIIVSAAKTSSEMIISIRDTGIGMTPEQVKKLGEPFNTTKDSGNGLGLMVSYKIIQNHQGRILVHSEINKGTTFQIIFPAVNGNQIVN
ncbi:ATP-binding protein [Peribacillus kribbensis]|uniref:ATP-binding protein n=1 Tax=Peribacillus kribbensis TaxID=356658 RepID=UPI00042285B2|nr:ATP-binding protein [Peribacillus kribbensis]